MPLFYMGKKINNLNDAYHAVLALPEPPLATFDESLHIKPSMAVICLESEMAYVHPFQTPESIQYVGTKYSEQCLFLRLHNNENTLIIHIPSANHPLDFDAVIEKFTHQNEIKVTLIGGIPGEESKPTLNHILSLLLKTKANITLEYQKVLNNNGFNEAHKAAFIRDKIIYKARLYYKYKYGKDLDLAPYLAINSQELMTVDASHSKDNLSYLAACLSQITEVISLEAQQRLGMLESMFTQYFSSEADFLKYLRLMFSKQGFQCFAMGYEAKDLYRRSGLAHFVIDIKNGRVHPISDHMNIPFAAQRELYIYDDKKDLRYFLAFDGQDYFKPTLGNKLKSVVAQVKPIIQQGKKTPALESILRANYQEKVSTDHLYRFAGAVLAWNADAPVSRPLMISSVKTLESLYQAETVESTGLEQLNLLLDNKTGQFQGRLRHEPEFTLDALLRCENLESGLSIRQTLEAKGIRSEFMRFEKEGLMLCVPAINVADKGLKAKDNRATSPYV